MNIVFRVDATKNIGLGHLMRCYALAEELINEGNHCFLISNIFSKNISENIISANIPIIDITTTPNSKKDLNQLIEFSENNNIEWIVTDHYQMGINYINEVKKRNYKVLSIDDTAKIYYNSDIVVNQNIGSEKLEFKEKTNTQFLLGPKYVMIRDELLKRDEKIYSDKVDRILVTFGGTNHDNLIINILRLLKETTEITSKIIFVIGPTSKVEGGLLSEINKLRDSNIKFVFSPQTMLDLYLESDIAISAGGSSCYELAYFGIPNIIISIADNQLNIAKELDKKNVSIYIGKKEDYSSDILKKNILRLVHDKSLRSKMVENGRRLVDGNGKKRITRAMNTFK